MTIQNNSGISALENLTSDPATVDAYLETAKSNANPWIGDLVQLAAGATSSSTSKTILINSNAELAKALSTAKGGETFILENNNEKYSVNFYSKGNYASEVTITSVKHDNPAVFDYISLQGSSNIHFDNISVNSTENSSKLSHLRDVTISNSSNISFTNSVFLNDAAGVYGHPGVEKADSMASIRNSNNIVFANNEMSQYNHGFYLKNTSNVVLSNNNMHDFQGDTIQMTQVTNTLIEGNYIHDVIGTTTDLNHQDMIQLWSFDATKPSTNILIRGNTFDAGDGAMSQTIFMRNDAVDGGGISGTANPAYLNPDMYYQNIIIEDNVIYNGHGHGITVGEANSVTVNNNTLIINTGVKQVGLSSNPTVDHYASSVPGINVNAKSENVLVADNIGRIGYMPSGAILSNNLNIDYSNPNAPNYIDNLFINAKAGGDVDLIALRAVPGGLIESLDIGANATKFNLNPAELTAAYTTRVSNGHEQTLIFDAGLTANSKGLLSDPNAKYIWDFGDGKTATGKVVEHTFKDFGKHDVTLKVISGREEDDFVTRPVTKDPILLNVNFENNQIVDTSSYGVKFISGSLDSLHSTASGVGYHLGKDDPALQISRDLKQFYNLDQFSVHFDITRDMGSSDHGQILGIANAMTLMLTKTGALQFDITDDLGQKISLLTSAVITDGKPHNVGLSYDSIADNISIFVDNTLAATGSAGSLTKSEQSWAFMFGGYTWNKAVEAVVDNIVVTTNPLKLVGGIVVQDDGRDIKQPDIPDISPPKVLDENSNVDDLVIPDVGAFVKVVNGIDGNNDIRLYNLKAEDHMHMSLHAGNDYVIVGAGNDWIDAGAGDDRIFAGSGFDTVLGGDGNDFVRDAEIVFGGNGNDLLVTYGEVGVKLYGENGDDDLRGRSGDDLLVGGVGNDRLLAGDGSDHLYGGDGNDTIYAGSGDDDIKGGDGDDYIYADSGLDTAYGGLGNDKIIGAERAFGDDGNDTLIADKNSSSILHGGHGDDFVRGGDQDDFLYGDAGIDNLSGGAGNDILYVDQYDNFIHGGSGFDTMILDFWGSYDFGKDSKIYNVEKLDMTNSMVNQLFIDYKDLRQSGIDQFIVDGDKNDEVQLTGSQKFTLVGQVTQDGKAYNHFHVEAGSWLSADLLVKDDINVSNNTNIHG